MRRPQCQRRPAPEAIAKAAMLETENVSLKKELEGIRRASATSRMKGQNMLNASMARVFAGINSSTAMQGLGRKSLGLALNGT